LVEMKAHGQEEFLFQGAGFDPGVAHGPQEQGFGFPHIVQGRRRQNEAVLQVIAGPEGEFPPLKFKAEKRGRGFGRPTGLAHHFRADSVAGQNAE